MATGTTLYSAGGISPRTNVWAAQEMLAYAMPVIVLDKFGVTKPMPKNKTQTIKFRRPKVFTAADTPLTEGVTPSSTQFSYEDVSATLKQYGQVVTITDVIEDTHEDPVLQDATQQCGDNIGRTIEKLTYGVLKAGTNVFYTTGAARASVGDPISLSKQRAVTRALKAQKARKINRMLSPSVDYGTRAVEACYPAVAHTDMESDIRILPGFTKVSEYGQRKPICYEEIGSVEDVRYVLSPDLDSFADAGAATSTMVTTGGTSADVYPVLFFGKEAYATIPLRGMGSVEPVIIPTSQRDKSDPLGQRGHVGWKTYFVAKILNELWMARLESAATAL
ncbi:MAG: N4-gp56 family major capsid protein [Rhodospirillaceae bacterium]